MKAQESKHGPKPGSRGQHRQAQEDSRNGSAGHHTDFDCRMAMVHELSRTLVRYEHPRFLGGVVVYGEWVACRMTQLGNALLRVSQEGKTRPGLCPGGKILCAANQTLFENTFDVLAVLLQKTTTEEAAIHAPRYPSAFREAVARRLIRAATYLHRIRGQEVSKDPLAMAA